MSQESFWQVGMCSAGGTGELLVDLRTVVLGSIFRFSGEGN